jgi:hypothetical protein
MRQEAGDIHLLSFSQHRSRPFVDRRCPWLHHPLRRRCLPVEYQIDHETRFVYARALGIVVLAEILDYFDAIAIQDAASYRKLFDARDAVPQLSDDDFMVVAARVSAYAAFGPRGAVALIGTAHDTNYALHRYANFFGGADRPARLFGSVEEARLWLDSTSA